MGVIEGKIENIDLNRRKNCKIRGIAVRAVRIRNMNFLDLIEFRNLETEHRYEENFNTYLYDQHIRDKSDNYRTVICPDSPIVEINRSFLKNSQVLPVDFET